MNSSSKKKSLVQLNLCTVLSRYWSVGRQRAESRLLHILHLIWLEVAKIDLFIEVNKIIFGPIHLLISLEQHQISETARFKCVCSHWYKSGLRLHLKGNSLSVSHIWPRRGLQRSVISAEVLFADLFLNVHFSLRKVCFFFSQPPPSNDRKITMESLWFEHKQFQARERRRRQGRQTRFYFVAIS